MARGNLTADGVVDLKSETQTSNFSEACADLVIFTGALGGLTENLRWSALSYASVGDCLFKHHQIFDHNGRSFSLSYQSEHLRVSDFAKNNNLSLPGLLLLQIGRAYPLLKLKHHRTCAVHDFKP